MLDYKFKRFIFNILLNTIFYDQRMHSFILKICISYTAKTYITKSSLTLLNLLTGEKPIFSYIPYSISANFQACIWRIPSFDGSIVLSRDTTHFS